MNDSAHFDGSVVPVRRPVEATLAEEGELALYDPTGAGLIVLNASSAAVWAFCDGEATLDDILAALTDRYDAEPDTLRADLWNTHGKLLELGLLSELRQHGSSARRSGTPGGPRTMKRYEDEEAPTGGGGSRPPSAPSPWSWATARMSRRPREVDGSSPGGRAVRT